MLYIGGVPLHFLQLFFTGKVGQQRQSSHAANGVLFAPASNLQIPLCLVAALCHPQGYLPLARHHHLQLICLIYIVRLTQGWRDWNQYGCSANQAVMEMTFRAMVDRSREVNGTAKSLHDIGYIDVGLGELVLLF